MEPIEINDTPGLTDEEWDELADAVSSPAVIKEAIANLKATVPHPLGSILEAEPLENINAENN